MASKNLTRECGWGKHQDCAATTSGKGSEWCRCSCHKEAERQAKEAATQAFINERGGVVATTVGTRYQRGELVIITGKNEPDRVLVCARCEYVSADYESNEDGGYYADFCEPTDAEKQSAEYQRLAARVAADAAERSRPAQTQDIEILDALLGTGDDEEKAAEGEPKRDEFLALFGVNNPDLCYHCQIKAKVRGDYCEECAQAIDARIAANEAEMRAEDAAAGVAWAQARKAGKSDDEQYEAYHEVKRTGGRGGARPGAGRKREGTTYEEGYQAGYKAGLRAKTIETSFDERVLPRWARQYPAVVERCKNNLAYRAQVCSATSAQTRTVLRREAGIR